MGVSEKWLSSFNPFDSSLILCLLPDIWRLIFSLCFLICAFILSVSASIEEYMLSEFSLA